VRLLLHPLGRRRLLLLLRRRLLLHVWRCSMLLLPVVVFRCAGLRLLLLGPLLLLLGSR